MNRFKVILLCTAMVLSLGCSRSEPDEPRATKKRPTDSKRRRAVASPTARSDRPTFVSCGGRYTNLVYGDTRLRPWRDSRDIEELEQECAELPENPDVWCVLGSRWLHMHGDLSNALACFEKAIEYAPDAVIPRLLIADVLLCQRRFEDLQHQFAGAYNCIKTERDMVEWARRLWKHRYTDTGICKWAYNFLKEKQDVGPAALLALAQCATSLNKHEEALGLIEDGLNTTTNDMLRRSLLSQLQSLREYVKDDARLSAYRDSLLDVHELPFERAVQRILDVPYDERWSVYPSLCREALLMATNIHQRYRALSPIVSMYANEHTHAHEIQTYIEDILGTNAIPTESIYQSVGWLRRAGATNRLRQLLEDAASNMPDDPWRAHRLLSAAHTQFGHYGLLEPTVNQRVIELVLERFPSNDMLLSEVAGIYSRGGWRKEEIACRKKLLAMSRGGRRTAEQAAALISRYVESGDAEEAKQLAEQYGAYVTNSVALAKAICEFHLSNGQTNDAYETLLACCENTRFIADGAQAIVALLDMHWPDEEMRKRAAECGIRFVKERATTFAARRMRDLYDKIVNSLVQLEQYDKAFEVSGAAMRARQPISAFRNLCKRLGDSERVTRFVHEMMQGGCTQRQFCVTVASACRGLDMPELALEMNFRAFNCSASYEKLQLAAEALRLAHDLNKTSRRDEILAAMDRVMQQNNDCLAYTWTLQTVMLQIGMEERFDSWIQTSLQRADRLPRDGYMEEAVRWYMDTARTNRVRELVATMCGAGELSLAKQFMLHSMYTYLGDTGARRRILEGLKNQLTNSTMVAKYGLRYISLLHQDGEIDDPARVEQTRALVQKLLEDPRIPFDKKVSLTYRLSEGREEKDVRQRIAAQERLLKDAPDPRSRVRLCKQLAEAYVRCGETAAFNRITGQIVNNPHIETWQLRDIAGSYARMGLSADAILLYERILAENENDTSLQGTILAGEADLYLKLGDTEQALYCAEELATISQKDSKSCHYAQIANIYQRAGKPKKALDLYLEALKNSSTESDASTIASQISALVRKHDLDFDPDQTVLEILEKERGTRTLASAASLTFAGGDLDGAKIYIDEALTQAKTISQKTRIHEQWLQMASQAGSREQQLEALEALLPLAKDYRKANVVNRISRLLMEDERYKDVIAHNRELLASLPSHRATPWQADQSRLQIVEAQTKIGNSEEAWETAQQLRDWSNFLSAARQLDRSADAIPRLEKELNTGDTSKRIRVAGELLNVYEKAGNNDAKAGLLETADELAAHASPGDATTLARIYEKSGHADTALELLQHAYGRVDQEQEADIAEEIVRLLEQKDRVDEAFEWLDNQPGNYSTYAIKARLCSTQERFAEAAVLYCDAITCLDKRNEWRHGNYRHDLTRALAQAKDDDLTDKVINRLLQGKKVADITTRETVAEICRASERYDDALEQYAKAVDLAKHAGRKRSLRHQYASCCCKARKYDEAADVYTDMLKDDSVRWEERDAIRASLANTYEQSRRPNKARDIRREGIRECERFIRDGKTDRRVVQARFRLAGLHRRLGNSAEAKRVLERIADDYKGKREAKRAERELKQY